MVSDNAPYFVSENIESFFGISHKTSLPYHPQSNGLAEQAVQIVKKGLRKVTEGTLNTRLSTVLFTYRTTPQSCTGLSPADLLLHYKPLTRLDLLFPSVSGKVEKSQFRQKDAHDATSRKREFIVGQSVYARNFREGDKWLPGHIVKVNGAVSFDIKLTDGRQWRRHQDHIRSRLTNTD